MRTAELRQALRTLVARPGAALLVVATLAIAIGCNAAMFGVVKATLLTPLPFSEPARLVAIWETTSEGNDFSASEANFLDFRARNRGFETLAASRDEGMTLRGAGEPVRVRGQSVSADWFPTLGIGPAIGRGFSADEDTPGSGAPVVVLGHGLWLQHFGGDRGVLGRQVVLDDRPRTVIGVMPPDFDFQGAEFWLPLAADPAHPRDDHWLQMIGRLREGVTLAQAQAELAGIAAELGREHPQQAGWSVRLRSFDEWLVGTDFRRTAWLLAGAVGLLMLMACANVGSVLFARATRRRGEFALRAALGARRGRLVRQQLVEVLLLVAAGVGLGIALAHGLVVALQAFGAGAIPRLEAVRVDALVVAFAAVLGVLAAALFGAGPVLRASRVDPGAALAGGARAGVSRRERRVGDALVVMQIATALVLLVAAGLLFRSLMALHAADTGYDTGALHAVELQLGDRHAEPWQKVVFFSQLSERLGALPGVTAAGATIVPPFSGNDFMNDLTPVERAAEAGPGGYMQARWRAVTPGFFDAVGLPLLRGRVFDAADRWDGPRLVVLSRTLAERLWPEQDPVGKSLYWGGIGGTPRIVAGVVGDYQDVEPGGEMAPVMFLPYNQLPWPSMTMMLRTPAGVSPPLAAVREAIHELDPGLAVPAIQPLEARVAESTADARLRSLLLGGFSLIALLLAAVGVYGVMSASAARRERELGLRLALGARPGGLVRMLIASGLRLGAVGVALGLAGAWAASHVLQGLLYGSISLDAAALLGSTVLLMLVLLAASAGPALRAGRVDPVATLQAQ